MVLTVRVDEAAPVPLTFAAGAEQVGESVAPDGLVETAQVKLTIPVKPPEGVTLIDVVFPVVAPGLEMVMFPPFASANFGAAPTTMVSVAVAVIFPVATSLPVTVAV